MTKKILLIDDEFGIIESLCEILLDEGYTVYSADNGRSGVSALKAHEPHLVFVDLMMPVVSGKHVLKFMRDHADYSRLPVIVMSAVPEKNAFDADDEPLAYAAYLRKPFRLVELLELIMHYVGVP